jgi:hypothetical protein
MPRTASNVVTPAAAKAEPKPADSQPESNPGTKKTSPAVVISIDKTNQKLVVSIDGIEEYDWPVSTGREDIQHRQELILLLL